MADGPRNTHVPSHPSSEGVRLQLSRVAFIGTFEGCIASVMGRGNQFNPSWSRIILHLLNFYFDRLPPRRLW